MIENHFEGKFMHKPDCVLGQPVKDCSCGLDGMNRYLGGRP